jgi:hypothetical protein
LVLHVRAESLCIEVAQQVLAKHGKVLTKGNVLCQQTKPELTTCAALTVHLVRTAIATGYMNHACQLAHMQQTV